MKDKNKLQTILVQVLVAAILIMVLVTSFQGRYSNSVAYGEFKAEKLEKLQQDCRAFLLPQGFKIINAIPEEFKGTVSVLGNSQMTCFYNPEKNAFLMLHMVSTGDAVVNYHYAVEGARIFQIHKLRKQREFIREMEKKIPELKSIEK